MSLTLSLKECLSSYCVPKSVAGTEVRAACQGSDTCSPVWCSAQTCQQSRVVQYDRAGGKVERDVADEWMLSEPTPMGRWELARWREATTLLHCPFLPPLPPEPTEEHQAPTKGNRGWDYAPSLLIQPLNPLSLFFPRAPRNTFTTDHVIILYSLFAQGRKSVSLALGAGQMGVDQMNSPFGFPQTLRQKETKLPSPCNLRGLLRQYILSPFWSGSFEGWGQALVELGQRREGPRAPCTDGRACFSFLACDLGVSPGIYSSPRASCWPERSGCRL